MKHLLTTCLLVSLACAQNEPPPAGDVRLTYELPVDALQRVTRGNPKVDLEKVLAHSVDVLRQRLAGLARVKRLDASRLTVDVAEADADKLQRVRQLAERVGTLRMNIVADPKDDLDHPNDTLAADREKLQKWLVDGGLERVLANPANLAEFRGKEEGRIVWLPRRIRRDGNRWQYSLARLPKGDAACIPLYDDDQWNDGNVPAAMLGDDDACLLELVAVDLSRGGFETHHFDCEKVDTGKGRNGRTAVLYEVVPDQVPRYSDWSHDNRGRMSAVIVDGEVLSAPRFMSRIPGRGIIDGFTTQQQAENLATALRSGPYLLPPKLVRTQSIPKGK